MWRSFVIAVCGLLSSSSANRERAQVGDGFSSHLGYGDTYYFVYEKNTGVTELRIVCNVMAIMDVGYGHACATVGTTLKCWGNNERGQLGRGDTNMTGDDPDEMGDDLVPVDLGTGEVADEIALGREHTCVLLSSGDVKCFGYNDKGQLGQGDTMSRGELPNQLGDELPAIDLGTGASALQLTVGCDHTCVLLDDESVKCFGYNNYGQLGQGTTDNIGDEAGEMGDDLVAVPLGGVSVAAISAGCDFTCAVLDDGDVICWGRNTYGQLGTGDNDDRLDEADEEAVAVDLGELEALGIAAGEDHVCARFTDATVKCWGRNNVGQLGLGDTDDRGDDAALLGGNLTTVQFGADDIPSSLDLGAFHSCALLEDGSIKCFGENGYGELGIGSTDNVGELPTDMGVNLTAVDLGGTALDVAAGGSSSCAVLDGGSIKCWGLGSSGQLGQGNDENIGDEPGVLADTAPIDLGAEISNTTTMSPTPSPLMTTAVPSSQSTSVPSASPTISTRGVTLLPSSASPTTTLSSAPSGSATTMSPEQMMSLPPSMANETAMPTAAPTASPTSTASDISVGGLLAAVVVGATGFLGVLFM